MIEFKKNEKVKLIERKDNNSKIDIIISSDLIIKAHTLIQFDTGISYKIDKPFEEFYLKGGIDGEIGKIILASSSSMFYNIFSNENIVINLYNCSNSDYTLKAETSIGRIYKVLNANNYINPAEFEMTYSYANDSLIIKSINDNSFIIKTSPEGKKTLTVELN